MSLHIAGETRLFWTVAVGMGLAVDIVVIILLNLLNKSVKALDSRVDSVWSEAVGVYTKTIIVAPELRKAEAAVSGLVAALRGGGPSQPAAVPSGPATTAAPPAATRPTGVAPRPAGPAPGFRRAPGRRW
ncbi:MAG: hypothetical protein J2P26_10285 [Nocardiopsaceae bacterium]|nr:hypothetical protein [Nocardiopsaceae bacterium]